MSRLKIGLITAAVVLFVAARATELLYIDPFIASLPH